MGRSGMEVGMKKGKGSQDGGDRPRGGRARSVSEMLPDVGRVAFRRFGFVQSSIVSRWHEIVGAKYADVTAPESIRFPQGKREQGTLNITVSSAYAPMIQHVEPVIMERVNRFFGYPAVSRVIMKQGAIAKTEPKRTRPELVAVPTELGDSLRTIADPELKAVLESLARGVATKSAAPFPIIGKIK
jgi:hypothetical protein